MIEQVGRRSYLHQLPLRINARRVAAICAGLLLSTCAPALIRLAAASEFKAEGWAGRACAETSTGELFQEGVYTLEKGKPVEREISGGETHTLRVSAVAGQYSRVVVEQKT